MRDTAVEPAEFLRRYPDYARTRSLDRLRDTEYSYLDEHGHAYLDYTGAGLAARAQYRAHQERLDGGVFGNPHSVNPTSTASTEVVESARRAVLRHLNADPDEYVAIFTANATAAARLVGEAYPFRRGTRFALTFDNHNSINGIRRFARAGRARTTYVPVEPPDLRASTEVVDKALNRGKGLFAYPAQSNFSGVQHPLEWVDRAQARGYDVLLDCAAFLPTNRLDLGVVRPEFVVASWYKVFGYPTGVGCLVARRDALARLRRPWFSGGTIKAVSVQAQWHAMASGEAAFEDGTVNFLSIPDVQVGLEWVAGVGVETIGRRVRALTGWTLDRLTALRHGNGMPLVRVYGPLTTMARGGTVTVNVLTPAGDVVDERVVAAESSAVGISLRTGCFCNPGAGENAFGVDARAVRRLSRARVRSLDEYLRLIGLPTAGAVRVSFGVASTVGDVERFVEFVETTYRDRVPDTSGLPCRDQC
ncbi:aminotransferase class V-fold PLP-dependent enzyme [Umezawaea endophytica]|uniref:Aminotransferase class V-fold PLP-dependent enzyme n=1 Tax=Umezawaea endophytica TaxID=1654476 RepID=A0A9X3AGI0_9PSEU|nr:aminotransferase class V-fold PLP-dependent enzyme [Umezawaea endophytica]MCS7479656.1 aminotransferase class V-fold PLP-dependent enzyme [Umezawaea endophytica]